MAALTALCLIAASRVVGWGPNAIKWGLGAAAVSSVFDSLRETLWFGQVNLLLGVLVMADCLLERTRWWPRGALIGLDDDGPDLEPGVTSEGRSKAEPRSWCMPSWIGDTVRGGPPNADDSASASTRYLPSLIDEIAYITTKKYSGYSSTFGRCRCRATSSRASRWNPNSSWASPAPPARGS